MESVRKVDAQKKLVITPWPKLRIHGLKFDDLIRERIRGSDLFLADVSYPNFNVYYEIGFAIAAQKPFLPLVNYAVEKANANVGLLGIFDTVGQIRYQNAEELARLLEEEKTETWTNHYLHDKDHSQPLFILDTLPKIDFRNYIVQAVTNSSVKSRAFDPEETPRLSLPTALRDISSSVGVILPLLSQEIVDWEKHNLRAAFLAGLSHGFGIETLIIQYEDKPAPLDYRDMMETTRTRREVQQCVEEYCQAVLVRNQTASPVGIRTSDSILDSIDIGASAAEKEFQNLGNYFVRTAEFSRALRANGSIVVGRKGSGKSAIFFEIMAERSRDVRNIMIDLKPASHSLSELREELLSVTSIGVFDHTIAAFWQFIIYAEILLKLREDMLPRAKYDFKLLQQVRAIEEKFHLTEEMVAGDFTSRLDLAVRTVISRLKSLEGGRDVREKLTNVLFESEIPRYRDEISSLAVHFDRIVLLFDNIDKGWPARQVEQHDIRMVRHLIDVLSKIQRELQRRSTDFQYALFLRSDVYENLVEETSDRGKYNFVRVDWSDPEQLEHLIRQRVVSNVTESQAEEAWNAVNPTLPNGKTAVREMIASSLMRPRFLIDLCERSISNAINRGHARVDAVDVKDALEKHSAYLVSDFGYEVRDVAGVTEDIFYAFLGEGSLLTHGEVLQILSRVVEEGDLARVVDLLLWYGFLGVPDHEGAATYIYDREYDMRRLRAEHKKQGEDLIYIVNPAFLRGLES